MRVVEQIEYIIMTWVQRIDLKPEIAGADLLVP
jgi:hypothetical protein